jgi:hypothetical protein
VRTRLLAVASLTVLVLALALPAGAAPAETLHFSFKGRLAEAFFSSTDASGCVLTEVYVAADDGRVKIDPGGAEAESAAVIFISQFDTCTGTQLGAAEGTALLAPGAFQIDKELTAATLSATIEVFDSVSDTSFPVQVNVSWTGVGDTTREKQRSHLTAPGFKSIIRVDGTSREATASGTVTDGTTNFTPGPAVFAELHSSKLGSVDIIRG